MTSAWTPRLMGPASIVVITLLGYFLFPGHTYLQSDTQIYVPMMERMRDPSLFTRDIAVMRPHLAYTAYDEITASLPRATGLDLEKVLTIEQLVFRALGVVGLILIALRLGLKPVEAWFVAAVVSLGATIAGPAVLTIEYEPVPRGFAMGLLIFALGLSVQERYLAAGFAAGAALLYHPPTVVPFLIVAAVLAGIRRFRWTLFLPVAGAAVLLMLLAHAQPPGLESPRMFRRLDTFDEWVQRLRAGYSYVSTWRASWLCTYAVEALIVALASWRLGKLVPPLLHALTIAGVLSVPVSWMLLEWQKWALIPQWQPARAVLFVSLIAALLSAAAGLRARGWIESALWLAIAFAIPMQHAIVGRAFKPGPIVLALGCALTAATLRRHKALILVPLLAFAAMPQIVQNYPSVETPELRELSNWARANTPVDAVFVFPEANTSLDPGIFRARALRALYVDWKSGGQVNYFPEFGHEWWKRRNEKTPEVDYIVLRAPRAGEAPVFSNSRYAVYATSSRDSRRSDSRNSSQP